MLRLVVVVVVDGAGFDGWLLCMVLMVIVVVIVVLLDEWTAVVIVVNGTGFHVSCSVFAFILFSPVFKCYYASCPSSVFLWCFDLICSSFFSVNLWSIKINQSIYLSIILRLTAYSSYLLTDVEITFHE